MASTIAARRRPRSTIDFHRAAAMTRPQFPCMARGPAAAVRRGEVATRRPLVVTTTAAALHRHTRKRAPPAVVAVGTAMGTHHVIPSPYRFVVMDGRRSLATSTGQGASIAPWSGLFQRRDRPIIRHGRSQSGVADATAGGGGSHHRLRGGRIMVHRHMSQATGNNPPPNNPPPDPEASTKSTTAAAATSTNSTTRVPETTPSPPPPPPPSPPSTEDSSSIRNHHDDLPDNNATVTATSQTPATPAGTPLDLAHVHQLWTVTRSPHVSLVLPPPTLPSLFQNALYGAGTLLLDRDARHQFVAWTRDGIIDDTVLHHVDAGQHIRSSSAVTDASTGLGPSGWLGMLLGGTGLTFQLFHQLYHNPLWNEPRPKRARRRWARLEEKVTNDASSTPTQASDDSRGTSDATTPPSSLATASTPPFFDMDLFLPAVGPALENLHNTLGLLRNHEFATASSSSLVHDWRQLVSTSAEGASSPDVIALATTLSQMTSPLCFDSFYDQTQLHVLVARAEGQLPFDHHIRPPKPLMPEFQLHSVSSSVPPQMDRPTAPVDPEPLVPSSTWSSSSSFEYWHYVPHSVQVNHVALLSARAEPVYPDWSTLSSSTSTTTTADGQPHPRENDEYWDDFRASENLTADELAHRNEYCDPAVAAQIDVLYEVSFRYERRRPFFHTTTLDGAGAVVPIPPTSPNDNDPATTEVIQNAADGHLGQPKSHENGTILDRIRFTTLAVAVWEGWLTKGNYDRRGQPKPTISLSGRSTVVHADDDNDDDDDRLQWKVAVIRDADEFHARPTLEFLPNGDDNVDETREGK